MKFINPINICLVAFEIVADDDDGRHSPPSSTECLPLIHETDSKPSEPTVQVLTSLCRIFVFMTASDSECLFFYSCTQHNHE